MSNDEIIKRLKSSSNKERNIYVSNLFTRMLISIILVLLSAIYINEKPNNLKKYKEKVFDSTISFAKISNIYNKTFGKVIPFEIEKGTTKMVFNETIDYNNIEKYNDGYKLDMNNNMVLSLYEGIVVFIGEKEGYGNTVIVQGSDGVDIWYGNVTNISVSLYDYINKNETIGEALDNKLYLVFNKEKEYLGYEEYLK